MTQCLLIAHGSPDPRHAIAMRSLASRVTERAATPCAVAFLEHDQPSARDWLASATGDLTTLGILLAPGYHATVDIPELLSGHADRSARAVVDRGVLGAGPWLYAAMDEVVAAAGADESTPVIAVSAGSSRADARAHTTDFVAAWSAQRTGAAYAVTSLADLPAATAAVPDAVIVPLLVAPGIFGDRIADSARTTGHVVAPVLGVADAFVDAVVERLGLASAT